MEEGDVEDDGGQDGQREGDEAAREEQDAGDDLGALEEGEHVAGRGQRGAEVGPGAGVRGHRDEVQEAVQAEDEEDEAEEDAGDGGELGSHGRTPGKDVASETEAVGEREARVALPYVKGLPFQKRDPMMLPGVS